MHFSLPWAASRVANAEFEQLGILLDEHVDQRSLAHSRTASYHQRPVAYDVLMVVEVAEELLGVLKDIFWLFE